MRKIIKSLLTVLLFFIAFNPVYAQKIEKIAVFPVDVPVQRTSYSLYPNILNLISGDIVNSLSKESFISVIDLASSDDLIRMSGLYKKYQKLLFEYKTTYTIDYDTCDLIAKKLGADKILLVSGGFDLQELMMERSWLYKFDIPFGKPLVPSYRLNITLTLVDPHSGIIVWENTYKNNFEAKNFSLSSQYFSENIISVEKIKNFSHKLSKKAILEMATIYAPPESKEVSSNILPKTEITKNESSTKDGVMTKDGHFSSSSDYLLNNRKENYKSWLKNKALNN